MNGPAEDDDETWMEFVNISVGDVTVCSVLCCVLSFLDVVYQYVRNKSSNPLSLVNSHFTFQAFIFTVSASPCFHV